MKKYLVILFAIAIMISACSPVEPAASLPGTASPVTTVPEPVTHAEPAPTDAVTVLQNYYQALTSNDLDKAMSFVADDAVFIDPMSKYSGKEEIRASLEPTINMGNTWEVSDISNTNGRLVYQFKAFVNGSQAFSTIRLTVVKEGKSSLTERKPF